DRQSAHPARQRTSPGRLAGDRLPLRSPGPPVRAPLAPAQASPGPLPAARGLVPHPRPTRGRQGEDRGGPLSSPPRPVQLQAGPGALYDITSTYFEGAGPAGFAKHGHSRDGKPHNVQVIVAVVMVAGWPIAHHVWAGNEVDHTTVGKAIADLHRRFGFNRLVFVGNRGMVTSNNLDAIIAGNHGHLVGLKRRRNKKLDKWLAAVDEAKWINCPVGITAREKADPPRTRAQEVPSGISGMRVIIVDSDERRAYEEAM